MSSQISSELKLATRRYKYDEEFKSLVDAWTKVIQDFSIDIKDFEEASKFTAESIKRGWKNG